MNGLARLTALAAFGLSLAACGGGSDSAQDEAGDTVNAADGINVSDDASGTTGSTTGDAGGLLNIANDAANDSQEANGASNAH
jgi:hypothetical protein